MFSALKKLVGSESQDGPAVRCTSNGQPMVIDRNLQKMFSKGVHYNMKIVIKGDRNVGKSCLWKRLQGAKFDSDYKPTDEIQVCHIQWSYKATDDIVKVEIWDVVDKGRKRKPLDGLKLNGNIPAALQDAGVETALDAEFIDVYKGTNGVIMMLDMTKQWTFEYVQRELPKIPNHIPVLVLANHLDMKHHRVVTEDQVKFFIEGLERPGAPVRYSESSMSNGFGLKFLHKFFNVPFLQLQREALISQLERNQREIEATCEELDLLLESDDTNYDMFVDKLGQRRRKVAENLSNMSTATPGKITGGGVLPAKLPKSVSLPADVANTILNKGLPPKTTEKAKPMQSYDDIAVEAIETGAGGDLNKFLEDAEDENAFSKDRAESESEDESQNNGNPLVSGFQDDLDPEDLKPQQKLQPQMPMAASENDVDSCRSSLKDSSTDSKVAKDEETSSPTEWQQQDLDELENREFGQPIHTKIEYTAPKEPRKTHKSSRKSKKDSNSNRDSSDNDKPAIVDDKKKPKKRSSKKRESLVQEDPLEAFLNDRSQYETI